MLNHLHRCIYVHIPKTGGNSVNRVFGIGWENHKDLQTYAGEVEPATFTRYYKFAIVRNPWERMLSDYNYQRKKGRSRASKLFLFSPSGERRGFADWVRAVLEDPHRYPPSAWGADVASHIHRWSPQVDWISVDGRIVVDRILRLERLQDEFRSLARERGWPGLRLSRRNRRLHWHYSWYYDDATRELVGRYYARDIDAFGYKFEESKLRFWRRVRLPRAARLPADHPEPRVVESSAALQEGVL